MSNLVLFVVMVIVIGGMLGAMELYGRYDDYVKHLARLREAEPEREKRAPGQHFSRTFQALFQRFSATFRPLFHSTFPQKSPSADVKVVHLGLLDDHDIPDDVLPEFEHAGDFIRWAATHSMISQGQIQTWFKGNTANLAYLVKEERDKYKAKYGVDLWSTEARRQRTEQEMEQWDDDAVQDDAPTATSSPLR